MKEQFIAIDLKSFYASVECIERGLDPLTTNLVVADASRTEKTICLAVSPSLKSYGVPGRPRLFEVVARVREVNNKRRMASPTRRLKGQSFDNNILTDDPTVGVDYITAPPRMALYVDYSTRIYQVYLKYFSPDDIHVYSIDEVFIDATHYLKTYKKTARELSEAVLRDVLRATGITATVGIGTNLYLAKVAMDIVAKRMKPDAHGVRIAELDEISYRKILWDHRPLTDFWRVGRGYSAKLEANGMHTMGDIAMMSLCEEDMLFRLFGINAELLIDHAWGEESCTMADIKAYKPSTHSLNSGQVLHCPYSTDGARLIVREMCDLLVLDMVEKGVATSQITLTIGYEAESGSYRGETVTDHYGRRVPKSAHGSTSFKPHTSSTQEIIEATVALFDKIIDPTLQVRRVNISANNLIRESEISAVTANEQLDFFTDYEQQKKSQKERAERYAREKSKQNAVISIRKKFGGNAILKGMNLEEGATTVERNRQIGGHKA